MTAGPLTLVPDAALEHPAVCLLGPLEFADGKSPSSPKERQTLALLAAQPGKQWNTTALIDELWAERPAITRPKQSVETYIYLLRRDWHLPIGHRTGGYWLDTTVDAARFVTLTEQARHDADEGHLLHATDTLRAAFSLWRGPVLGGVEPTPWLSRWAAGIEDRRRTARLLGFDIALKLGHHRDVLDDLREELRADWSREDIAETLMVALYRSQRRAEALNIYRTVREALAEEHGLDPCPRLQRLQQQILSGDPSLELNGEKVDVRESSLATERRVWIHAGDGAAHLNVEQAKAVRDALDEWLNEFNGDPSPEAETKSTATTHLGGPDCWCGDPTGHAAIANAALGITQGTPNG